MISQWCGGVGRLRPAKSVPPKANTPEGRSPPGCGFFKPDALGQSGNTFIIPEYQTTRISKAPRIAENGALNCGKIFRLQGGSNVPSVQENTIQAVECNAGEHVRLGPDIPAGVKERVFARGDYVMACLDGIRGDGTERNHEAHPRVMATAWGHDDHMTTLHHLGGLKARRKIANQDRTRVWMEGDRHRLCQSAQVDDIEIAHAPSSWTAGCRSSAAEVSWLLKQRPELWTG